MYPSLIFCISDKGKEIYDTIQLDNKYISDKKNQYRRFIRTLQLEKNGDLISLNSKDKINIGFKDEDTKRSNYSNILKNTEVFVKNINKELNEIYTLENQNFASDNEFKLSPPNLIVLASIDDSLLSPFLFPLLQNFDSIKDGNTKIHLILTYNGDKKRKTAFLKELESYLINSNFNTDNIFIWLLDSVNEKGFSFNDNTNLYKAISQFIQLLTNNSAIINKAGYDSPTERGKPCIYSTFGYSILSIPVNKIKRFIETYATNKEYTALNQSFDIKYQRIALEQELINFITDSTLEDIPKQLEHKEDKSDIYPKFNFNFNKYINSEKDDTVSEQLTPISECNTISATNTTKFKHDIEISENAFKTNSINTVSIELNNALNRILKQSENIITKHIVKLIDDPLFGFNYARIFSYLLINNESIVHESLEGKVVSYKTLNDVKDKFRSLFIGNDIIRIEGELKTVKKSFEHNKNLIEKYTKDIININQTLRKLEEKVGIDNPKYIELGKEKETKELEIIDIENILSKSDSEIEYLTEDIEKIKADFERASYKQELKDNQNKEKTEEIQNSYKNIDTIDELLPPYYEEKNNLITDRSKHILYKCIIIPSSILLVLLGLQTFLFIKTEFFNLEVFIKYGIIITIVIELVWWGYALLGFLKIKKMLSNTISKIKEELSNKKLALMNIVNLTNDIYYNNFTFDKNLIAYDIIGTLIEKIRDKASLHNSFIELVNKKQLESEEKLKTIIFIDNDANFSVVEKGDIKNIFDKKFNNNIIGDEISLSDCVKDFFINKEIPLLNSKVIERSQLFYNEKINNLSIDSIIFNKTDDFSEEVKPLVKVDQVYNTSRPWLRTELAGHIFESDDIANIQNISIGKRSTNLDETIEKIDVTFIEKIEDDNDKLFGILSIKSNFPAFIIYDIENNEKILRKEIQSSDFDKFFINKASREYSLLPSHGVAGDTSVDEDIKELGYDIIFALTKKIINYNSDIEMFTNDTIGNMGASFDELIDLWNKGTSYEVKQEVKELEKEYNSYDEDEKTEYKKEFSAFVTDLILIPKSIEGTLETYFFIEINGEEIEWDIILKKIKENRKKLKK